MIYTIPTILTLIILAIIFRDEMADDTSEYLAMVCLGAIFWPVTVVYLVVIWFEWRRG